MDDQRVATSNIPAKWVAARRRFFVLGWAVVVCLATLLLLPVLLAAEGGIIGPQSGCGTNPVQDWYFVSSNKLFVTLTGTISSTITLNAGSWWDDGDWNVHVVPDDRTLLVNSRGRANATGDIELEVNSNGKPSDLATRFPPGTRIEAYGEWVEDMGHDPDGGYNTSYKGGKTELHPLYWMRTINATPDSLYVAQDDTGRFVDAQNPLFADVDFPINAGYPKVTPWAVPPSRTQVFEESGRIARGTSQGYASPGGYSSSVQLDSWWFFDCESVGHVVVESPHYFATIRRTTAPLLRETVTYRVSTDVGTGQKIANLGVVAELDSPPQGTLAGTHWRYETSGGVVTGTVDEWKNQPPHRVKFSVPYAPALGYTQHKWHLSVEGWTQPGGPLTSTEIEQPVSHTVVTEGRKYVLHKSRISLDRHVKGTGICGDAVYLTVNESALLPQIALKSLSWTHKIQRNTDGSAVANPVETAITPDSPLNDPGFSATTYNRPNDKRLDVVWKKLSSGQPNLVQVMVTARAVTELGESIWTAAFLSPFCGIDTFSYSQILDYSYRLLASRGLKGELYKVIKNARGTERRWLEALAKFANGEKLTVDERGMIILRATEGSRLPALPSKPKLKPFPR